MANWALASASSPSRPWLYPAATWAPASARLSVIAAPIPRQPPVTTATLPSNIEPPDPAASSWHAPRGRIDFLVNNAGINLDKTVRKMTVDEWHAVLRVNLSGGFYRVKAVLNHMIERGSGRIVNISSVIGQVGNIGQANYAASKSGQFGFTKSLALKVARKGITVNCVAPGFIKTEMVAAMPEKVLQAMIDRVPVGRLGQATDVARCVRFLLEDEASYITGAVLTVNGGLEM